MATLKENFKTVIEALKRNIYTKTESDNKMEQLSSSVDSKLNSIRNVLSTKITINDVPKEIDFCDTYENPTIDSSVKLAAINPYNANPYSSDGVYLKLLPLGTCLTADFNGQDTHFMIVDNKNSITLLSLDQLEFTMNGHGFASTGYKNGELDQTISNWTSSYFTTLENKTISVQTIESNEIITEEIDRAVFIPSFEEITDWFSQKLISYHIDKNFQGWSAYRSLRYKENQTIGLTRYEMDINYNGENVGDLFIAEIDLSTETTFPVHICINLPIDTSCYINKLDSAFQISSISLSTDENYKRLELSKKVELLQNKAEIDKNLALKAEAKYTPRVFSDSEFIREVPKDGDLYFKQNYLGKGTLYKYNDNLKTGRSLQTLANTVGLIANSYISSYTGSALVNKYITIPIGNGTNKRMDYISCHEDGVISILDNIHLSYSPTIDCKVNGVTKTCLLTQFTEEELNSQHLGMDFIKNLPKRMYNTIEESPFYIATYNYLEPGSTYYFKVLSEPFTVTDRLNSTKRYITVQQIREEDFCWEKVNDYDDIDAPEYDDNDIVIELTPDGSRYLNSWKPSFELTNTSSGWKDSWSYERTNKPNGNVCVPIKNRVVLINHTGAATSTFSYPDNNAIYRIFDYDYSIGNNEYVILQNRTPIAYSYNHTNIGHLVDYYKDHPIQLSFVNTTTYNNETVYVYDLNSNNIIDSSQVNDLQYNYHYVQFYTPAELGSSKNVDISTSNGITTFDRTNNSIVVFEQNGINGTGWLYNPLAQTIPKGTLVKARCINLNSRQCFAIEEIVSMPDDTKESKGKATINGTEYNVVLKPLTITDGGVTTTYNVLVAEVPGNGS